MPRSHFPITRYAWRRFKLIWAEYLVSTMLDGEHTDFHDRWCCGICGEIKYIRDYYYPLAKKEP